MYLNGRYDELEPRPVPKPTQFQEIIAKPEVPELSLVFDSDNNSKGSHKSPSTITSRKTQETYNEWKCRQNRSPVRRENHYYEPREKPYSSTSSYDYDHYTYNRFSDNQRSSYKSESECHKCSCQNTPTVKDIYSMMQMQNDQMKFLLETIQKLLVTVLANQQTSHKCCCSERENCKKDISIYKDNFMPNKNLNQSETSSNKYNEIQVQEKPHVFKTNDNNLKPNITENGSKQYTSKSSNKASKQDENTKNPKDLKSDDPHLKKDSKKEKIEKAYSIHSDESFELNENDVQVVEAPISPEQSIHIEMKSSSSDDDCSNSENEDENEKKIEVGWTMYNNILGQVNDLLKDKNEPKSDAVKPVEHVQPPIITKPMNFESYKHFMLPKNGEIDSSLQMQALAMQYLSPEQAVKFDINQHLVPATQPNLKSANNFSFATLQYMERYQLINPQNNYTPVIHKLSSGSSNKKKKSSRKNKAQSKILNVTELKQQPKLL
ncbi:SCL-interrupting locus protein homolog isoform X2 [Adelges cooleyi]|uniref:SCL-interrupting locus protein homolog isoform X2 n=1 Tax=Adelges cooleyi TaxID=133065 RepID=UPI0021809847|nr:SCL-interrupting locus protein homolog isoform X2 [Adelges cooleyi]